MCKHGASSNSSTPKATLSRKSSKGSLKLQTTKRKRRSVLLCVLDTCCGVSPSTRGGGATRLFGFILFTTIFLHRYFSLTMQRKHWVHAPIHFIYRQCPKPDYPTISNTTSTAIEAPKICLTTLTDETKKSTAMRFLGWRNFDGLLQLTTSNKESYCRKHGYSFYDESDLLDASRPPSWSKIRAVKQLLTQEDCEWVFWMDADTVIMNSDVRLEDFLPDNNATQDLLLSEDDGGGYNAGSWIIHRSEWSIQFLDKWWNMTSYINPVGLAKSGDNDALKALTATASFEFDRHVLAPPRCTFNSFAKFVPPRSYDNVARNLQSQDWYMDLAHFHKSDFVAHTAGVDNKKETLEMLLELAT